MTSSIYNSLVLKFQRNFPEIYLPCKFIETASSTPSKTRITSNKSFGSCNDCFVTPHSGDVCLWSAKFLGTFIENSEELRENFWKRSRKIHWDLPCWWYERESKARGVEVLNNWDYVAYQIVGTTRSRVHVFYQKWVKSHRNFFDSDLITNLVSTGTSPPFASNT